MTIRPGIKGVPGIKGSIGLPGVPNADQSLPQWVKDIVNFRNEHYWKDMNDRWCADMHQVGTTVVPDPEVSGQKVDDDYDKIDAAISILVANNMVK
jgi:hypothetical protein